MAIKDMLEAPTTNQTKRRLLQDKKNNNATTVITILQILEQSRALHRSQPFTSCELANTALQLAENHQLQDLMFKALLECAYASHRLGRSTEMSEYLHKAKGYYHIIDAPNDLAAFHHLQGLHDMSIGLFTAAYAKFHHVITMKQEIDIEIYSNAVDALGLIFQRLGDLDKAIEYHVASLEIRRTYALLRLIPSSLTNLATAYTLLEDKEKAIELLQESLRLRSQFNDQVGIAITCKNMGTIYRQLGQLKEGLKYLQRALSIWKKLKNEKNIANLLANVALTYADLQNNEAANKTIKEAMYYAERSGNRLEYMLAVSKRGVIYKNQGEDSKAQSNLEQALLICHSIGMREYEARIHHQLAEIASKRGRYKAAYQHLKTSVDLQKSIAGPTRQRSISIAEQRRALHEMQIEKELLKIRAEHAEQESRNNRKELDETILHLVQKNEMLKDLHDIVAPSLKSKNKESRDIATVVLKKIEAAAERHTDWQLFEEQFERIHHDFIQKLTQQCSILTPTEIRVCVLIKLNLSTKQIADMLFSSVLTIKTHRTHIRRKLGLAANQSLAGLFLSM